MLMEMILGGGNCMLMLFPDMDTYRVSICEKSMPAFTVASQVINIFRSPILYQVWSSLAFTTFERLYSTVARSCICCKAVTMPDGRGEGLPQAQNKIAPASRVAGHGKAKINLRTGL
jgi:hypothetical protein